MAAQFRKNRAEKKEEERKKSKATSTIQKVLLLSIDYLDPTETRNLPHLGQKAATQRILDFGSVTDVILSW